MLTVDERARAAAALDAWWADGSPWGPPDPVWTDDELIRMHAALHAPTARDAVVTYAGELDPALVDTLQEAENIALMTQIRSRLEFSTEAN